MNKYLRLENSHGGIFRLKYLLFDLPVPNLLII